MKPHKSSTKNFFCAARAGFRVLVLILMLVPLLTHLPVAQAEGDIDWIKRVSTYRESLEQNRYQVSNALGPDGSVYIFGSLDGTLDGQTHIGGIDLYIRKYDPNGAVIWTRQFGTIEDDFGQAIAVDASGIYVAGSTNGAFEGFTNAGEKDSFVAKYDLDGNPLWAQQLGCFFTDFATGIAVLPDGAGVSGFGSCVTDAPQGYLRKFSADGALQWSTLFEVSSDDDWTRSSRIATDETGVYVAGSSGGSLFVKKFNLSGGEVWTQAFAGDGTSWVEYVDAISVYGSRVYIAGNTSRQFTSEPNAGLIDIFLKTFDTDGTPAWTLQFGTESLDNAYALAVDSSGVYVGGKTQGRLSDSTPDGMADEAFIRQYSLEGVEEWTFEFGSTSMYRYDDLTGIAVSPEGIYLSGRISNDSGFDIYLKKIDQTSSPVWTQQFTPSILMPNHDAASAVDANGNAYLVGYITHNPMSAFVAKYSPAGSQLWMSEFTNPLPSRDAQAMGVASGADGSVYVIGTMEVSYANTDVFLTKYSPDGVLIWTRQFGSAYMDRGEQVAVDGSGIYIAGKTVIQVGEGTLKSSVFVRKYSRDGEQLWADQFIGADDYFIMGMAIHSSGLYLGGAILGTLPGQINAGSYDAYMRKYSPDGTVIWTRQFGTSDFDLITGVDVDDSGVYVTGVTNGALGDQANAGGRDVFVQRYSLDGNTLLWTRQFGTVEYDDGAGIAVNQMGVYAVWNAQLAVRSRFSTQSFIQKFSSDGVDAWSRPFDNHTELSTAEGVAVDDSGIYVAGFTWILDGYYSADATLIKFSLNENEAPVAVDQSVATNEGTALEMVLVATDADNDSLTYSIVTGPANGTLSGTAPNITYTPEAGYSGSDSFTFKANDGLQDSNVATVNISVIHVNHAPVAQDQSVATNEGTTLEIILVATDLDNDSLTYSIVAEPANGTLSGTAPNNTYTPNSGYFGPDSFTFKANDGAADSNVATVNISVVHVSHHPSAIDDSYSTNANTTLTVVSPGVLSNDTDEDGDLLSVNLVTGSAHGTLMLNADGSFTYTPTANYAGQDSFTYRANDGELASNIATASITVSQTNTAPTANPGGPYLGAVNTAIQFDGFLSSDPENDSLTYAWTFGDGATGTDAAPTHSYAAAGINDVCLTVNDGSLDSDQVCTLAVIYDPSAGFVTGGGWINSPAGAYKADETLAGKATFGFVSKYQKGASVPTGNTAFEFDLAGLAFSSESYEWLVVNRATTNAQFKGSGLINGTLDPNGNAYKFMLWAGDGSSTNSADTFRIRIWWEDAAGEHDVYDNGVDQSIGGGSIVVHAKK